MIPHLARCTALWSLLVISVVPLPLHGWVPSDCSEAARGELAVYEARLVATGSTETGVPHPYPRATWKIIENLRYQLVDMAGEEGFAGRIEETRELFALWSRDELGFEVVQAENWLPNRCVTYLDVRSLHVVRAWRRDSGREVLRAALGRDGHVATWRLVEENDSSPRGFESLAVGGSRLDKAGREGMAGKQYIVAEGNGPLRCPMLAPCIAARSRGGEILVTTVAGDVYRLDVVKAQKRMAEVTAATVSGDVQALGTLLTAGHDAAFRVEKLPPD